jgi:hypothetical protein
MKGFEDGAEDLAPSKGYHYVDAFYESGQFSFGRSHTSSAHLQVSAGSADMQSSSIADSRVCDRAHERFGYIQIRSHFEYDTCLRYLGMHSCKDTGWTSALLLL